MTNGEPILVRGVMKPIPTLYKPLDSVDIETHEPYKVTVEQRPKQLCQLRCGNGEAVNGFGHFATEVLEKFSSDNWKIEEAVAKHRKDFTRRIFKRKSFPLKKLYILQDWA